MTEEQQYADRMMTMMLLRGATIPLGVKADTLIHRLKRRDGPLSPESLVGRGPAESRSTILKAHRGLRGYQFSWGVIAERKQKRSKRRGGDGTLEQDRYFFTVIDEDLLRQERAAGDPGVYEHVLFKMFLTHPLCVNVLSVGVWEPTYELDGYIELEVSGDDRACQLRAWLADVFIPRVRPNLVASYQALLQLHKDHPTQYRAECEKWIDFDDCSEDTLIVLDSSEP